MRHLVHFVLSVGLWLTLSPLGLAAPRPNIVVLLADDQRPDTIHALGNAHIRTPNLDRLVARGVSFSHAHIMGGGSPAVCVPSRAQLMSGRTTFRCSLQLNNGETPLPAVFARQGYETFGTGKWHNGGASFARAFGGGDTIYLGGMADHFRTKFAHFDVSGVFAPGSRFESPTYSTNAIADTAIEFIRRQHDRPYLCYAAFTAPHDPRTPPAEYATMYDPEQLPLPANYLEEHPFNNGHMLVRDEQLTPWPRTPEIVRRELADYYGMISHLDAQIGRVLQAIQDSGQADNTIVVFAADNGLAIGSHGLLGKQNMYEHSLGVPLVVAGPGIVADRRSDALCYLLDLFPTLAELAGVSLPSEVEGRSFAGVLKGDKQTHRDTLFGRYLDVQRAVRDERWKLIRYPQINRSQLFDLQSDPQEANDLAYVQDHAPQLARMLALLQQTQHALGDTLPLTTDKPQPYRIELKAQK